MRAYLEKIDHFELNENELSKKEIQFLYNKKIIEFNSCKVGEYFNIENIKEKNNITIFVNDKNNSIKIKQITFRDNHGDKVEIMANKRNTIRDLIMRYLGIVEHWELIEREGDIQFLYNQKNLNYNDQTSIEEYFKNEHNPIVKVNDFDDLLLKEPINKYCITFKTSQGFTENLSSFLGSKMEKILSNYLNYIGHPELINDKSKITFLYKAKIIDEKTQAFKCFKNESNPEILVIDTNNLLTNLSDNKSGPKFNVIFKTSRNEMTNIIASYYITIDKFLKNYLWKMDLSEYIDREKINFLINAKQINFGDQTPVEQILRESIIVIVNFISF